MIYGHEDNRLVVARPNALCHEPERGAGPLNGLRVAG
jgi:hypothetical protein